MQLFSSLYLLDEQPECQDRDVTRREPSWRPTTESTTSDAFNGKLSWDKWIDHFESVAHVIEWNDATHLLWLKVRRTGKAQNPWRCISNKAKDLADVLHFLVDRVFPDLEDKAKEQFSLDRFLALSVSFVGISFGSEAETP